MKIQIMHVNKAKNKKSQITRHNEINKNWGGGGEDGMF